VTRDRACRLRRAIFAGTVVSARLFALRPPISRSSAKSAAHPAGQGPQWPALRRLHLVRNDRPETLRLRQPVQRRSVCRPRPGLRAVLSELRPGHPVPLPSRRLSSDIPVARQLRAAPLRRSRGPRFRGLGIAVGPDGRLVAENVAEREAFKELVDRGPRAHPVARPVCHNRGVVGERCPGSVGRPCPVPIAGVPVEEVRYRRDPLSCRASTSRS